MSTTELFDAVKAGDVDQVQALLAADPQGVNAHDDNNLSLLMTATYYGHQETIDLLVRHAAEIDVWAAAALGRNEDIERLVGATHGLVNAYSADGWTPLHLAAYFGHTAPATTLLQHGADVQAKSTNALQNMPIHSAVSNDHLAMVGLLLQHGADPNVRQQDGWTPLHGAAHNGNLAMAQLLTDHGANPRAKKDDGQTPRDTALEAGHAEVAEALEG